VRTLVEGTRTKADLWLASLPSLGDLVIKDFSRKPAWLWPWSRLQIAREAWFLRALAGVPGIPRLVAAPDRLCLVTEYIAGKPLFLCRNRPSRFEYLSQLEAILAQVHAMGIIHNDLRGRENVHVADADNRVYLLDWAGAVRFRPGSWSNRVLFERWKTVDDAARLKWKAMLSPESLSDAERQFIRRFGYWRRLWPLNRKGVGGKGPTT
jgi:predicted Ser/Thr protein kinase